ncbi:pentatricopeptide repeat-containing protein At4g02750-like [Selaginella moellendorffii]|uniref:pentatricopeptide repeat-containing protein At4g02750-like n=1 Tax=Selaginella moellendorffii TaxID=88036 RepID=UPI000D1C29F8|nr:pentatricopeptide repeat-containing protein At4g02750-like [Selaginella moellendorffii]|eukprot:XP_024534017.1 pentatricopeptide repeat-containing protein At4g02750-like [Selaginella moellendorffii]
MTMLENATQSKTTGRTHNGALVQVSTDYFAHLLKQCGNSKDPSQGDQVYRKISSSEFANDRYLGNLLIEMYGKCGQLDKAQAAFDRLDHPNTYSWNIIVAAYARNGQIDRARDLFDEMPSKDVVSWNAMIAAYAQDGDLEKAKALFDRTKKKDLFTWNTMMAAYAGEGKISEAREIFDRMEQRDLVSWNTMINAYSQNRHIAEARKIFDAMKQRNEISWNTMIFAYAQNDDLEEAERLFERMPHRDAVAMNAMVQAYAMAGRIDQARQMLETTLDRLDWTMTVAWNALIAACGERRDSFSARAVFDRMPDRDRDVVSWNTMISVYTQAENLEESRRIFRAMPHWNVISWNSMILALAIESAIDEGAELYSKMGERDVVTWTAMIKLLGEAGKFENAREIFEEMPERDAIAWNAMLAAYALHRQMEDSRALFLEMPHRNVISWNTMIQGLVEDGQGEESIRLFQRMDLEGVPPDAITLVTIADAASSVGSLDRCRTIHESFRGCGAGSELPVANALISMYGKCGSLADAHVIFDKISGIGDVVSWNALLAAYSQAGHHGTARNLLRSMILDGVAPNGITFIGLLSTCSHAGMVIQSCEYFASMWPDHGIIPGSEHYHCIVDILGRSGWLQEALDAIGSMPFPAGAEAWTSLLTACSLHSNAKLGSQAAHNASEMDLANPAPYMMLSGILTAS